MSATVPIGDAAATRRAVLAALARGDLPAGGPSELAARDLIEETPSAYWDRWIQDAAERLRKARRLGEGGDRR